MCVNGKSVPYEDVKKITIRNRNEVGGKKRNPLRNGRNPLQRLSNLGPLRTVRKLLEELVAARGLEPRTYGL